MEAGGWLVDWARFRCGASVPPALTAEDQTELLQPASVYVSLHGNRRLDGTRAHS